MADADIANFKMITKMCLQPGPKGFRCTEKGSHTTHRCVNSASGEVYDEWT